MKTEKSSRRFWIALILGFFSIDIVIATIAITMAVQDPSFRSIPGFSQRSVHWGERQEKQMNLNKLGWKIEVEPSHTTDKQLAIKITDGDGNPVSGAKLITSIFHYTRVAEQQSAPLIESDNLYIANFDLAKPGYWNIDIEGASKEGVGNEDVNANSLAESQPATDNAKSVISTGLEFWHQMRWEQPRKL